jgi:glutathione S-transferase
MLRYFIETGEGEAMLASFPRLKDWMKHMQARASARATSFHSDSASADGF